MPRPFDDTGLDDTGLNDTGLKHAGRVRSSARRYAVGSAAMVLAVGVLFPAAAAADDLLVIPIGGIVRGAEGEIVNIGSVAVPDDLIGATCEVRGETRNQISVHEGNDLLITTGGQTFIVPNFEDAGFITHSAGRTEAVGETIQLQIRLGPDGLSSGGFRVSIDCAPVPTTTAPTNPDAPPTSDGPETTTAPTNPDAPPTSDGPETTTAPTNPDAPPTSDGPAGPEVTTESTEVQPTETTTTPSTTASPDTAPPPAGPTAVDDEVGSGLPATGSTTGNVVGAGLALIGVGLATRRFARSARSDATS